MRKKIAAFILDETACCLCGSQRMIQVHHVFSGPYRKASTKFGMVVPLCMECHTGAKGVHHNQELNLILKRRAQEQFELYYGDRDEFRKVFGKSYL